LLAITLALGLSRLPLLLMKLLLLIKLLLFIKLLVLLIFY